MTCCDITIQVTQTLKSSLKSLKQNKISNLFLCQRPLAQINPERGLKKPKALSGKFRSIDCSIITCFCTHVSANHIWFSPTLDPWAQAKTTTTQRKTNQTKTSAFGHDLHNFCASHPFWNTILGKNLNSNNFQDSRVPVSRDWEIHHVKLCNFQCHWIPGVKEGA